MAKLRNIILGHLLSALGGSLCVWLKTPLPWIIGPLVAVAICNFNGARLAAPPLKRELGQFFIAMTFGRYFTPAVAKESSDMHRFWWPLRLVPSWLAISPVVFYCITHASTMQQHSLWAFLVVYTVPVLMTISDVHGGDVYQPVVIAFNWAALFAVAAVGGTLLSWTAFPDAWMMGSLVATIVVKGSGFAFSSILAILTNAGKVLLGCAWGARFSRQFVSGAPRFVAAIVLCIVLMVSLSAGTAWNLAIAGDIFLPSMILAAAPGGIAEMPTTARALRMGVAADDSGTCDYASYHRYVVATGVSVAAADAQKKLFAPQVRQ